MFLVSRMRIIIQHALSRSYFNGRDWNANEEDAANFETVVEAEEFCRAQNLGNALIVLKFREAGQEISYKAWDAPGLMSNHRPVKHPGVGG